MQAGYPVDAEVVLIIEVDGLQAEMAEQISRVKAACERNHVRDFQTAQDEQRRLWLWRGRKGAFGAVAHLAPGKLATDITVPRTVLPQVLRQVMALGEEHGLQICNVFHAGDGNLHPLILFDPSDPDEVRRAKQVDDELVRLAVRHGGVLTGEHGIGSQKRKFMALMFGAAELAAMQRVKDVFDPSHLANPGKVLPDAADLPPLEPLPLPRGDFEQAAEQLCARDSEGRWRPYDCEAAVKLLALAGQSGQALTIRGSGSKSGPASDGAQVVSTLSLNRMLRLDTDNLTATVQAGVRLAELNEALAERGQTVPLRPAYYERVTVGGVVASADSGLHRLLYGAPRDLLTGLEVALPEGRLVRFGGACVKNVSGYAMEKLFIGSWGTLGMITEVTLRALPLPERRETLMLTAPAATDLAGLLGELRGSFVRPAAVELLNASAARHVQRDLDADQWVLFIALEGLDVQVREQLDLLSALCRRHDVGSQTLPTQDYDKLWQAVADLGGGQRRLQLTCPPAAACALADEVDPITKKGISQPALIAASVNLGTICVHLPTGESLPTTLADRVAPAVQLDAVAAEVCGGLKQALDPQTILPALPWL